MSLANEAGYLYVLSKKLTKLNGKIKDAAKVATKHKSKYDGATKEHHKKKYKNKHDDSAKELRKLVKEHNEMIVKIKHHTSAFIHALKTEHKLK